jgi:hypothetical protein
VRHQSWPLYTNLNQLSLLIPLHWIRTLDYGSGSSLFICGFGRIWIRVSFETSFDSKQPKLEPKLVSSLSKTKPLFLLFRLYIEIASFGVSIKPKLTKTNRNKPKQTGTSPCSCPWTCLFYSCQELSTIPAVRVCRTLLQQPVLSLDMSTLHKPVLQSELPLDGSVLQQPMLPLDISVLKQTVLPGRVFSIEPMMPLDGPVLKQPVLPLNGPVLQHPELPLHVSVLLFYSILCCI